MPLSIVICNLSIFTRYQIRMAAYSYKEVGDFSFPVIAGRLFFLFFFAYAHIPIQQKPSPAVVLPFIQNNSSFKTGSRLFAPRFLRINIQLDFLKRYRQMDLLCQTVIEQPLLFSPRRLSTSSLFRFLLSFSFVSVILEIIGRTNPLFEACLLK